MSSETIYASYPVFRVIPEGLPAAEHDVAAKEASDLLEQFAPRVQTRGGYSTAGFRADADIVFWWVAQSPDDLQDLYAEFRPPERFSWGWCDPPSSRRTTFPRSCRARHPRNIYASIRSYGHRNGIC